MYGGTIKGVLTVVKINCDGNVNDEVVTPIALVPKVMSGMITEALLTKASGKISVEMVTRYPSGVANESISARVVLLVAE